MKPSLLIAMTNRGFRQACRHHFEKLGYAIEEAAGGIECLAVLKTQCPDVVVLDLELPWGGGDGVLACIRDQCAAETVVVLLTANLLADERLLTWPVVASHAHPVTPVMLALSVQTANNLKSSSRRSDRVGKDPARNRASEKTRHET